MASPNVVIPPSLSRLAKEFSCTQTVKQALWTLADFIAHLVLVDMEAMYYLAQAESGSW